MFANAFKNNKIFELDLLPASELPSEKIDGKRFYILPDGTRYKSVTTVLSEAKDQTGLAEWRERVGAEEAERVSRFATDRGTALHTLIETYLNNKLESLRGVMPHLVEMFQSIRPHLDSLQTLKGIELALYSHTLRTAGKCDLFAVVDGYDTVVDFKTARKPKRIERIEDYFLQVTCYAMMIEELYGMLVPKGMILIAVEHDAPQVFVFDNVQYREHVNAVFRNQTT